MKATKYFADSKKQDKIVAKAIKAWVLQGRDFEHIVGVKNFMSGRGIKMVQDIFEAGRQSLKDELNEEQEKFIQGFAYKKKTTR